MIMCPSANPTDEHKTYNLYCLKYNELYSKAKAAIYMRHKYYMLSVKTPIKYTQSLISNSSLYLKINQISRNPVQLRIYKDICNIIY